MFNSTILLLKARKYGFLKLLYKAVMLRIIPCTSYNSLIPLEWNVINPRNRGFALSCNNIKRLEST